MKTINVNVCRPYSIHIGQSLIKNIPELMSNIYTDHKPKLAIITDDIVDSYYSEELIKILNNAGYITCKFVFPNGESSKSLETVSKVYEFLSQNNITRTDVIIALGGGVVGDLAGFAASNWLRGIDFIQLPTTFLAMIDSSVGGKTGVDIPQGKNLIGAFWQPRLVICDTDVLNTLSREAFSDGVAEAIKYGSILDADLFTLLKTENLYSQIEEIINRCVSLKCDIVEHDEFDTGIRQVLNFGHTFGHAIEKYSNYTVTHGCAVAIGMVLISSACERVGITPMGVSASIADCCEKYGLPTFTNAPIETLCQLCMGDKKHAGKTLTLIALERIGKAVLYPINSDDLLKFMEGSHV